MNRILAIIITAAFAAITSPAQSNVAVKYSVSCGDSDNGSIVRSEMILIANTVKSLYFNPESQYVDSCCSTPEGAARLREIQLKAWRVVQPDGTVTYDGRKLGLAPEKKEYLYVEKSRDGAYLTVYDSKAGDLYSYQEPLSELTWTIVNDSTKNLLGHECIMAYADYHGRKWTAWFTPEIPVQDGPWKLHGLPGLILRADGGDGFVIDATEVGTTLRPIPPMYSVDDYEKGERRQILKDHEHYINNFESMMAAQGIKLNADGSSANLPKFDRHKRAWETDY
ncbi:MAG TPA: GLPGLI family protein [Candidatus Amulumruptor caecigallinarius]|uniref:GLPGLI family protein n=1 Tax=Candidatus Amulumruptor caecigallinarius TaxID=2109911 RepID=A0A921E7Q3_9BACT|nr:GLPGLI family protein [Candidatus Amulumruptor caecigallinarius]